MLRTVSQNVASSALTAWCNLKPRPRPASPCERTRTPVALTALVDAMSLGPSRAVSQGRTRAATVVVAFACACAACGGRLGAVSAFVVLRAFHCCGPAGRAVVLRRWRAAVCSLIVAWQCGGQCVAQSGAAVGQNLKL